MNEVIKVVFNSDDPAIIETDEDTLTLGLLAVARFIEEMLSEGTGKNTRQFMSCVDGKRSWKNMTEFEKESSVMAKATTDPAESHFAYSKNEKHKFGTNLSVIGAGAVAASKTMGYMKRVLGKKGDSADQGFWHKIGEVKQNIIVVHAEREAKKVRERHKRAVKAVKEHKGAKFKLDEEKDAQAAFNKYKRQLQLHGMIFTDQCFKV